MHLTELETPALVLDRSRLDRNLERMSRHIRGLGGVLRPHVKTAK
jgi:D-serine deaminase-like pyridoxal phosphate-dependent protein